MKNKLLLFLVLLCGTAGALDLQAQVSYQVKGTWKNGEGEKVYLKEYTNQENAVILDSTTVTNDQFILNGKLKEMKRVELSCSAGKKKIFIDGNSFSVTITEKTDTIKGKVKNRKILHVSGGGDEQEVLEKADEFTQISGLMQLGEMFALSKAMENKDTVAMKHNVDSIQNMFKLIKESIDKNITNFLDSARNSYAVTYFIDEYIGKNKPIDEFKKHYNNLTDKVKNSPRGLALKTRVDAMASASVGGIAPNIELSTPEGGTLSLYSLRGHIVLLDFWASWCGPCLREVPNIKKIYDKYHSKGLEVLGVSLDEKADAWKNAIVKKELNWKHISSLKGWTCPAAKLYNVTGIPRMYIIDETGRIIAQDLRGDKLAEKMDELFKGK